MYSRVQSVYCDAPCSSPECRPSMLCARTSQEPGRSGAALGDWTKAERAAEAEAALTASAAAAAARQTRAAIPVRFRHRDS